MWRSWLERRTDRPGVLAGGKAGPGPGGQAGVQGELSAACCFSNKVQVIEHYHNSSWLEHGGAPEKATKNAFVSAVDKYLRDQNKYQKNESKITWQDIEDCLIFVSNNFSTQTSYENQTKKSITNKFVQEAMTEFLRTNLEIYFIENHFNAEKIAEQVW